MGKTIQFEGTTHEFPDDFTDDDIRKALASPSKPTRQPIATSMSAGKPAPIPELPGAWEQFKQWGSNIIKDLSTLGKATPRNVEMFGASNERGAPSAAFNVAERISRPVENAALRYFDPTGALGGSMLNLESNRPFEHDPAAAQYIKSALPALTAVGGAERMTSLVDSLSSVKEAVVSGKMSYKEAQEFLANLPLTRAQFAQELASLKKSIGPETKAALRQATSEAKAGYKSAVAPLQAEKAKLQAVKVEAPPKLGAEEQASRSQMAKELRGARSDLQLGKKAIPESGLQEAKSAAQGLGPQLPEGEIADQALKARQALWDSYEGRISPHYDSIEDTFANNVQSVGTGKFEKTGVVDAKGVPITREIMQDVAHPVTGFKTPAIMDEFEPISQELNVAVSQGSPGARAIIQAVNGPDVIDGKTALENIKALNKIGYDKADAVMGDNSRRLAKTLANAYREALKGSLNSLPPVEAQVTRAHLDAIAPIMRERDALLKTKPVLQSAGKMERYGDINRLVNDPIGLQSWWRIAPEQTRSATRRQLADKLVGNSYTEFINNWRKLPQTSKSTIFPPETIAKMDQLATDPVNALSQLTQEYADKVESIRSKGEATLGNIAAKRRELSQLTLNIQELTSKMKTMQEEAKTALAARKETLVNRADQLRQEIQDKRLGQSLQWAKQTREAKDIIGSRKRAQRILWFGLAGLGAWQARNALEAVLDALGNPGR